MTRDHLLGFPPAVPDIDEHGQLDDGNAYELWCDQWPLGVPRRIIDAFQARHAALQARFRCHHGLQHITDSDLRNPTLQTALALRSASVAPGEHPKALAAKYTEALAELQRCHNRAQGKALEIGTDADVAQVFAVVHQATRNIR